MIAVCSPSDQAIAVRRDRLLQQAVEDGNRRYRNDLRLVYYQDHRPTHRGGHVAQESLGYAAALLSLGQNTERARILIEEVLRHQNLNKSDRCYGGFFWFSGQDEVIDHNAVSFVVPWLGWLVRHHAAELGEPLCTHIRKAMKISLDGLLAHPSAWSYTNIFLLNIAAKFAIAEICDDPRARGIAEEQWREWLYYTNQFGVVEYLSPTYTAVQIEALELILDSSASESVSEEAQSVLNHYWTDLLLCFHKSSNRFVGTFSRGKPDEYLKGRSALSVLAFLHLGVPSGDLGCYNATHALSAREISPPLLETLSAPLPRKLHRKLPMQGIERWSYLAESFAFASQRGAYHFETSLLATWKDGGFFHKAPGSQHQNYCQQQDGHALLVERWLANSGPVSSRWTVFDRRHDPCPTIKESARYYLLADFPIPSGHLVMELFAPSGYRIERSEHSWSAVCDITEATTCPLIAVSLSLRTSSPYKVALSMKEETDFWLLLDESLRVAVPKKPELLCKGAGWDVPRGQFLDAIES